MNRAQQNTWRMLEGKEPLPTMEEIVAKLKHYVDTYENQQGFKDYTDETLIDDVLYGLGAALSEEYEWASGFEKFKKRLVEHIEKSTVKVEHK